MTSKNTKWLETIRDLQQASKSYHPKYRNWSAEEDNLVREFHGKVPVELLATKLKRTLDSVISRAHRLHRGKS